MFKKIWNYRYSCLNCNRLSMKKIYIYYIIFLLSAIACNTGTPLPDEEEEPSKNQQLVKVAGKDDMILLTDRPLNLETPLWYFKYDYTPNNVFFVRWHLANMPTEIDSNTFRLKIGGHVNRTLSLSLHDLKTQFKPYTITALAACAGNARSYFDPQVPGGQWKNGAMGNAKWTGVKLKDILNKAGIKSGAFEVSFNGLDEPPLESVPDFVKSLKIDHALDGEVMVAYEMNDRPLPILNGYPLKLVVPGWYATYWVGMLSEIKVYNDSFKGYWMKKAYLVPKGISNGDEKHDKLAKDLVPISKMDVRSIFVSPEPNTIIKANQNTELEGLAFDGGDGIIKVEISLDNGHTWQLAKLNPELGKYAWRRWKYNWKPSGIGKYTIMAKATNAKGETQPAHQWNRSGYMRNEIESLTIIVE